MTDSVTAITGTNRAANSTSTQDAVYANYDAEKAATGAIHANTVAEVRAAARSLLGHTVEFQGEVKGCVSHTGMQSIVFQVAGGEELVLDTPSKLQDCPALRVGGFPRILVRIDGSMGDEIAFTLLNATDTSPPGTLFHADDDADLAPIVVAPLCAANAPRPEVVMDNPVQQGTTAILQTPQATAQPGQAQNPLATNIDPEQRAAYSLLARRYNPKLTGAMADYIAVALLMAAGNHHLDPRFLASIVSVESSFDPYCLSSAGAMGLGQLMPFNLRTLGVANAWDPMQNLDGAARLLRANLDRFANQPDGTLLAVAAYHAGGTAVVDAGLRVPDRPATEKYVWKVYYAYRALAPDLFH